MRTGRRHRSTYLAVLVVITLVALALPRAWTGKLMSLTQVLVPFQDAATATADMLADRGIRKLGHLQRFSNSFHIEDLAVEENGNILLLSSQARNPYPPKSTLYLLKSP